MALDLKQPILKSGTVFEFNEDAVKQHFAKIEEQVNKQQGKRLHNPYIWLNRHVEPLIKRFTGYTKHEEGKEDVVFEPERTESLYNAIMSLPIEPPLPKIKEDTNPTETNIRVDKPLPPGLNLPNRGY